MRFRVRVRVRVRDMVRVMFLPVSDARHCSSIKEIKYPGTEGQLPELEPNSSSLESFPGGVSSFSALAGAGLFLRTARVTEVAVHMALQHHLNMEWSGTGVRCLTFLGIPLKRKANNFALKKIKRKT